MNSRFAFTKEQRRFILAALNRKRLSDEIVNSFVIEIEREITYWQRGWPPLTSPDLVEGRRKMKSLEKHLAAISRELRCLPGEWKLILWNRLIEKYDDLPPNLDRGIGLEESKKFGLRVDEFIYDLWQAVYIEIEAGASARSRENASKYELVRNLARLFHWRFKREPTSTPASPFMRIIAIVSDALGLTIGKDAISTGLKEYRAHAGYRDFVTQQI